MNDYGQYRYKNPNSFHSSSSSSGRRGNLNGQSSNPYQYNSFNLSPTLVLVYVICGLAIIYNLLQQPLQLPPLWLLPIYPFRRMLGQNKQKKIENIFGGGIGLLRQGQGRILSGFAGGLGAGTAPFGAGDDWEGWVGGLYNSGNTCYQNCVLQAMASLHFLSGHLSAISSDQHSNNSDEVDGVISLSSSPAAELDNLAKTLNTRTRYPRAFTPPHPLRLSPSTNSWFHEQQDAQEFFQKLTAELEKEAVAAWKNRALSAKYGLEEITKNEGSIKVEETFQAVADDLRNPFEGLLAQRVGCLRCGYVEAIRMQGFTSLSLALPSSWSCGLNECLQEFTSLETLNGVPCERCTLLAIKARLHQILEDPPVSREPQGTSPPPPTTTATPQMSSEVREALFSRLEKVEEAIQESDFSSERLKTCNISKRNLIASDKTKQIMIARSPLILVLHMNRSMFDLTTGGTRKNYAVVEFNPVIDLEPWVVGSSSGFGLDPSLTMRIPGKEMSKQSTKYILRSVIAHYGSHGSGHYVCYRQTYPSKSTELSKTSDEKPEASVKKRKPMWWRCSDCDVRPADEEEVLAAGNAFMLYYERMSPEEAEEMRHIFNEMEEKPEDPVGSKADDDLSTTDVDDENAIDLSNKDDTSSISTRSSATEEEDNYSETLNDAEYFSESVTSNETAATTPNMSSISSAARYTSVNYPGKSLLDSEVSSVQEEEPKAPILVNNIPSELSLAAAS